jgi:CMP-N,N'-diacetyllegionaminic acid synthase
MKTLFLIPARGGSKGIPHKNRKILAGKPLICYAIDAARKLAADEDICVSTDDDDIIRIVEEYGLRVPFKRPNELAQDGSGSYETIIHAIDFFEKKGRTYETVVLLQPTSPFRTAQHIREAMNLYTTDCDMVVSVCEAKTNPYYVMFEEDKAGYLQHVLKGSFTRRQDCPVVYEYNGAVYVMNVKALRTKALAEFTKNRKYVMTQNVSVDLDTMEDWEYVEFLIGRRNQGK